MDDLLGETYGPGQTLLLHMALFVSTKKAGLRVEDHQCVTVRAPNYHAALEILQVFPVDLVPCGDGSFTMCAGPVEIYSQILVLCQCYDAQKHKSREDHADARPSTAWCLPEHMRNGPMP